MILDLERAARRVLEIKMERFKEDRMLLLEVENTRGKAETSRFDLDKLSLHTRGNN